MYNRETFAAKGEHGNWQRHRFVRSMQRAAVNIFKTDKSYELLVFAPGRIKEHFHLDVKGNDLTVSYKPPEGFARPEWALREYSRGGFERTLRIDDSIEKSAITAKYADGVLEVSLPIVEGKQTEKHEISVN